MEQGIRKGRYSVIPRTLTFVFHEGRLLLLRGAKDKQIWAGLYNGVGGHVEQGEDIYTAAIRELEEETGISGIPLDLSGLIHVKTEMGTGVLIAVFRAEAVNESVKASPEGELDWIPVDDISQYPLVNDLYQLIPRVVQWTKGDPVLFGLSRKVGDKWMIRFAG